MLLSSSPADLALRLRAARAEQAFKGDARIHFHGERVGGGSPGDRVGIDAAIAESAGA